MKYFFFFFKLFFFFFFLKISFYGILKTKPKKSSPIGLKKYKVMLEELKKEAELMKKVCGFCHVPLPENMSGVVELSTLNFHEKCFKCYDCRVVLEDEFCEYQGNIIKLKNKKIFTKLKN